MRALLGIVIVIAALGACGKERSAQSQSGTVQPTPTPGGSISQQIQRLAAEISKLTAKKACTRTSDCGVLGFGYKACGGPESYLVYSKRSTNETTLKSRVQQHAALQKQYAQQQGLASTCDAPVQPSPLCSRSVCTGVYRD